MVWALGAWFLLLAVQSDRTAPFATLSSSSGASEEHEGTRRGGNCISAAPACDPSGTYCAVPLESGDVELLELATGSVVRWPRVGVGRVEGVAFDELGETLAVWNWTNGATLRAVPSGETILRLPDRSLETWWKQLAFSCDGERLLTWEGSQAAYLWDARSGELIARLENESVSVAGELDELSIRGAWRASAGTKYPVTYAGWDATGEHVLTCSGDGVRTWDSRSGARIDCALDAAPGANYFAFDASGTRVALACFDRVRILDARTGVARELPPFEEDSLFDDDESVSAWEVAFHPGGELLLASDSRSRVWLTSLESRSQDRSPAWRLVGWREGHRARFEKGGAWVALVGSGSSPGGKRLVETATDRSLFVSSLPHESWLAVTPDGRWIVDSCPTELRVHDGRRLVPIHVR